MEHILAIIGCIALPFVFIFLCAAIVHAWNEIFNKPYYYKWGKNTNGYEPRKK